jgi:hypothetical protein
MSKQLFNHKSLEKQHREAILKLPINDSQAVEDVRIYASMSDEELNNLPTFCDDGSVKFYTVGNTVLGKLSLIQFVKSIKNK